MSRIASGIGISGHMETGKEGFALQCLDHHDFPVDGLRHYAAGR